MIAPKDNRRGSTLLMALMGGVVMVLTGMALMSLMTDASKGSKKVKDSFDFENLKSTLRMIADDGTLCRKGLLTAAGTPITFSNIGTPIETTDFAQIKLGNDVIALAKSAVSPGMTVDSVSLSTVAGAPVETLATGDKVYRAKLVVNVLRDNLAMGVKELSNKTNPIYLSVVVNAGNTMIDCNSTFSNNSTIVCTKNILKSEFPAGLWTLDCNGNPGSCMEYGTYSSRFGAADCVDASGTPATVTANYEGSVASLAICDGIQTFRVLQSGDSAKAYDNASASGPLVSGPGITFFTASPSNMGPCHNASVVGRIEVLYVKR